MSLLSLKSAFYSLGAQSESGEAMTSGRGFKKGIEGCQQGDALPVGGGVPTCGHGCQLCVGYTTPSAEAGTLCSGPLSLFPRTGSCVLVGNPTCGGKRRSLGGELKEH